MLFDQRRCDSPFDLNQSDPSPSSETDGDRRTSFESPCVCEHEQQNRVQTAVVPQRGVRKGDLKMSERYSTVVRSTAKKKEGGGVATPKSDDCEKEV